MAIMTTMLWIRLIFLFIICILGIIFQIYLSKKENKFLGMILPVLSFLYSIMGIMGIILFSVNVSISEIFGMIMGVLIPLNIPTIILLIIYFICRNSNKKKKQLDKMNIQDL